MGITKEFLLGQMRKIETNYGKEKFVMNPDLFDLWYEMFQSCEEEGLKLAVDKCIKESEFAPNIATLMKFYKELENEREEMRETISHEYGLMRSVWEEEYDDDTFKAIVEYVYSKPKKNRKVEMVELSQTAISFYHELIAKGIQERPTILEYVKGVR